MAFLFILNLESVLHLDQKYLLSWKWRHNNLIFSMFFCLFSEESHRMTETIPLHSWSIVNFSSANNVCNFLKKNILYYDIAFRYSINTSIHRELWTCNVFLWIKYHNRKKSLKPIYFLFFFFFFYSDRHTFAIWNQFYQIRDLRQILDRIQQSPLNFCDSKQLF